jgi:hypothetical protein
VPHRASRGSLSGYVAALLGVALVIGACAGPRPSPVPNGSPAPVGSPSALPTGSPSASVPAAATAAASAITPPSAADATWSLVQLPDSGDVGSIADITTIPGMLVVAAAAGQAGERGIAWTSSDQGATWVSEPIPKSARSLGRLVPWGDRVMLIGEADAGCAHPSVVQVQIRAAAGGWTAAPFDPIFCAGGLPQGAAAGTHAVIVGAGAGDVPYAWSSDDGLRWADHSGPFVDRLPQGVAVDGTGFVAFGTAPPPASAWVARSTDGTAWENPQPLPGLSDATIVGNPAVLNGDLAILAGAPDGSVGLFTPDGSGGWGSQLTKGLTRSTLSRVIAVDGGLVAIGGDERGPAAWASSDGVQWRPLALPPEAIASGAGATLTGVAVADGRAYLVGQIVAATGDRGIGALWTGPAALLAP